MTTRTQYCIIICDGIRRPPSLRVPPDKRGKAAARHGGRFKYRYALFEELLYEDNFDDGSVTASESTDSRLMREELRTVIAGAIEGLKEKERQVITLYYYKSMKYSDIAKVIGVSESRVCQINTKAMLSLKAALEPYINGGAVPGKQGAGQEVRS